MSSCHQSCQNYLLASRAPCASRPWNAKKIISLWHLGHREIMSWSYIKIQLLEFCFKIILAWLHAYFQWNAIAKLEHCIGPLILVRGRHFKYLITCFEKSVVSGCKEVVKARQSYWSIWKLIKQRKAEPSGNIGILAGSTCHIFGKAILW